MTFNHSCDVMMTSFIFEERTGDARYLGSSILNLYKCIQFYFKPEEIEVIVMEKQWSVYNNVYEAKNIFQQLPFGHFKFMFLFPNQSLKSLDYTSIHIQLEMILLN